MLVAIDGLTQNSSEAVVVVVVAVFGGWHDCCKIQSKQNGLCDASNVDTDVEKSSIGSKECISNEKTLSSR